MKQRSGGLCGRQLLCFAHTTSRLTLVLPLWRTMASRNIRGATDKTYRIVVLTYLSVKFCRRVEAKLISDLLLGKLIEPIANYLDVAKGLRTGFVGHLYTLANSNRSTLPSGPRTAARFPTLAASPYLVAANSLGLWLARPHLVAPARALHRVAMVLPDPGGRRAQPRRHSPVLQPGPQSDH